MIVRDATEADMEALIALGRLMHGESPRYRRMPFEDAKVRRLAAGIMANGILLVAEDDGRVVGMLAGVIVEHWFTSDKVATDVVLYVHPEARGGRAFVQLVASYEARAKLAGASEVAIGISAEINNNVAVACCLRLGYRQASTGMVKDV